MTKKPQITILFGTDKDVKKTYVFEEGIKTHNSL